MLADKVKFAESTRHLDQTASGSFFSATFEELPLTIEKTIYGFRPNFGYRPCIVGCDWGKLSLYIISVHLMQITLAL